MKEKTPRSIITEELGHHQTLILLATISAFGFSAWYWTSLPTHGYTKFDAPALFASFLGLCFVAVYEFSKLMAAKKGHSNRFFMAFVVFSILTGVGTHMHSEQGATEEKMSNSALFNTSLDNIKQADAIQREYAYAAGFDVAALEKEKAAKVDALLASEAMKADGKPSGNTVGAVISKGWKSYAHYKTQLDELKSGYDQKIQAKQKYDSAINARSNGEANAKNTDGTETAEASWLIQIIGQILGLFGITEKTNAWSSFVLYLFATIILEMTVRFNGKQISEIRKKLYGFDPDDIQSINLDEPTKTMQTPIAHAAPAQIAPPAPEPQQAPAPAPTAPAKPAMRSQEATERALNTIRNMTNSGALPISRNHIISATRVEFSRLAKTHDLPDMDHEAAGMWIYNVLKKEQAAMQPAAAPQPQHTPTPSISMAAVASANADPVADEPRRPIGFVQTDKPTAEFPTDQRKDGTGINSPVLGKAEAIFPLPLPAPDRVEAVQPPPASTLVDTLVEPCRQPPCNLVDNPQQGQANKVDVQPQQGEQKPNQDTEADNQNRALDIIWKGIDKGIIDKVSVSDNGKCQAALKGHNIGKSNPQRRDLLAWVFDALNKEGVITANPEYTDPKCGRDKWLINPNRSIKYAA